MKKQIKEQFAYYLGHDLWNHYAKQIKYPLGNQFVNWFEERIKAILKLDTERRVDETKDSN
jgi:hypothetical protein